MNHPPLAPKSVLDKHEIGSLLLWRIGDCWPHGGDCLCVETDCPQCKSIVAAVAEVEWRKRAERWEKLYVTYSIPLLKREEHQIFRHRGNRFKVEAGKAIINALAWRAWGSTK